MKFVRPLDSTLIDLFHSGRRFRYRKGDVVFRETDGMSFAFLVDNGYVKAYTLNEDSQESIVQIFGAGEIFPITWMMHQNMRIIFYEAITPVNVYRITMEVLSAALREPGSPAPLHLLSYAADQIVMLTDRIDNLQYTSAYQRVAYRIAFLAERFGKDVSGGKLIDIPLTQQDIANAINLSRETTSRVIEKLENQGLISYRSHRILVKDVDRLRAELIPKPKDK